MSEEIIIDFRLLEVGFQLSNLSRHLSLIEEQIVQDEKAARTARDSGLKSLDPTSDEFDFEEQMLRHEYEYQVEIVFPFIYRNPFILVMYSVYESAVTEIADLVQKKQARNIAIGELKGDFLSRAKKYFVDVLDFKLVGDSKRWEKLQVLRYIRNIVAHSNGRLNPNSDKQASVVRKEGFSEWLGFLLSTNGFLRDMYEVVKGELDDLVQRYKDWDSALDKHKG